MFDDDLPSEFSNTDLQNELERYLNEEADPKAKDVEVLSWWKAHQRDYSRLYRMALNFHTIPGKSILLLVTLFTTTRQ